MASDLLSREADIAIRNFHPEEPDLIARKFRDAGGRFYASVDYLKTLNPVGTPADLMHARFIALNAPDHLLPLLQAQGFPVTEANIPIVSRKIMVIWEMVRPGHGIGYIDDRIGDKVRLSHVFCLIIQPSTFPSGLWAIVTSKIAATCGLPSIFWPENCVSRRISWANPDSSDACALKLP